MSSSLISTTTLVAKVVLMRGRSPVLNWQGIGMLNPGEEKALTSDQVLQCKKYTLQIDPENQIYESNENDNKWEWEPCKLKIQKVPTPVLKKRN